MITHTIHFDARTVTAAKIRAAERNVKLTTVLTEWPSLHPILQKLYCRMAEAAMDGHSSPKQPAVPTVLRLNGFDIVTFEDGRMFRLSGEPARWEQLPHIPQAAAPAPEPDPVRDALVEALRAILVRSDGWNREQLLRRYSEAITDVILSARAALALAEKRP